MELNERKETCETCEHNGDSSTEYCGCCDQYTPMWKEASYIKDTKIKNLTFALERIRDIALKDSNVGESLIKDIAIKTLKELEDL